MKTLVLNFICMILCMGGVYAQNSENVLDLKERQIAAISGSAAKGDKPGLTTALAAGLDAGLTVNEIKEVLVQLYAYCGFPRSMGALNTFMSVLQEREAQGIHDAEGALPTSQEAGRGVEYGRPTNANCSGVTRRVRPFRLPRLSTNTSKRIFSGIYSDVTTLIGRSGNLRPLPCSLRWRARKTN